ncbi:MAG: AAA family ATPase [Alphaproteobacteria bacterium]|nr:AAA family ATPase [Alphaproteobacteria bacterium]
MAAGVPVIVIGNEKGGSGKTTVAIHLVVDLLYSSARVGVIDLDARQQSLTRFFVNRAAWAERRNGAVLLPRVVTLTPGAGDDAEERARFDSAVEELGAECDVVLVDCPGADTALARAAHTRAQVLVTPLNDSFVDFDLLASVDPETNEVKAPSVYAERVWDSRKRHVMETRRNIDWLVVRNRVSPLDTRNQRKVNDALAKLGARIGFRLALGLTERVVFRELFPKGLTILDLVDGKSKGITMSQLAARQEVRALVAALRLPLPVKQAANG